MKVQLADNEETGNKFNFGIELHEIIGFYTAPGFIHVMYSQLMNESDGMRFVSKWILEEGTNNWELDTSSRFTVLDMVVQFDRRVGF